MVPRRSQSLTAAKPGLVPRTMWVSRGSAEMGEIRRRRTKTEGAARMCKASPQDTTWFWFRAGARPFGDGVTARELLAPASGDVPVGRTLSPRPTVARWRAAGRGLGLSPHYRKVPVTPVSPQG